jgi:hypothetical protein
MEEERALTGGGDRVEMAEARCASCGRALADGQPRHALGALGEGVACAVCVGEHDPEAWAAGWEAARNDAARRAGYEAFERKRAREQAAFVASWAGPAPQVGASEAEMSAAEADGGGGAEMVSGEGCEMFRQWSFARVGTDSASGGRGLHEPSYRCGLRHANLRAGMPIYVPFPVEELDGESFAAGLRDGRRET